jgi:mono/diheme cytochrome c family protein
MKRLKIVLAATILLSALSVLAAPPSEEGKTIFTARCAACHNVNKILVGPALAGVDQRRSIDWIIQFVHSSQKVVKSGDPYAVELFNKFNKVQMPDHPDLTADDIKNVVAYIKTETGAATEKPVAKAEKPKTNILTMILSDNSLLFTFSALILVLVASLILAIRVKQIQRNKITK